MLFGPEEESGIKYTRKLNRNYGNPIINMATAVILHHEAHTLYSSEKIGEDGKKT
jgi:hypothetical protein